MIRRYLLAVSLFFPTSLLAVPVATFDASSEVGFTISDPTMEIIVESSIFGTQLNTNGTGAGAIANSGNFGPAGDTPIPPPQIPIPPDFTWNTSASGEASSPSGSADIFSLIDGMLTITNPNDLTTDFTLSFTATLMAQIFTANTTYDSAIAFASIFIADETNSTTILDQFLEFDSSLLGAGTFPDPSNPLVTTVDLPISLATGQSITFSLALDANGIAATTPRPVQPPTIPEPGSVALLAAGLMGLFANRRRLPKFN